MTDRWSSNCPRRGLVALWPPLLEGQGGGGYAPSTGPKSGCSSPEHRPHPQGGSQATTPVERRVGPWDSCRWVAAHACSYALSVQCTVRTSPPASGERDGRHAPRTCVPTPAACASAGCPRSSPAARGVEMYRTVLRFLGASAPLDPRVPARRRARCSSSASPERRAGPPPSWP